MVLVAQMACSSGRFVSCSNGFLDWPSAQVASTTSSNWSRRQIACSPLLRRLHSSPAHSYTQICRCSTKDVRSKRAESPDEGFLDFAELDKDTAMSILELELESAYDFEEVAVVRHYEVMFLVHEDHADGVRAVIEKVQGFIKEKKGKIWRINDWGLRKLAYKIQKASKANYILMNFEMGAEAINEFKSLLDKDERVIRHLVITQKEAITIETVPPPEYGLQAADEDLDDGYDSEEEFEDDERIGEKEETLIEA